MDHATEQRIREHAYALWEKEGSPAGRDDEFWERARLMVEAADRPAPVTSTPVKTAADHAADTAIEDTFPASDPPSFTADVGARSTGS